MIFALRGSVRFSEISRARRGLEQFYSARVRYGRSAIVSTSLEAA